MSSLISRWRLVSLVAFPGFLLVLTGCSSLGGQAGCAKLTAPDVVPQAVAHVETRGITKELDPLLTPDQQPVGWIATYVTDEAGQVVATSKPEIVGMSAQRIQGWQGTGTPVKNPEGREYMVWTGWDRSCRR